MRASDFEFRYRFWIIGSLFWAAFQGGYAIDPMNAGVALASALAGPRALEGASGRAVLQGVFAAGAALVALAALLRTWAAAYLRSEVVHDSNLRAESLVADGPYRHVRNPLYLGTTLLSVGFAPMASRAGAVALVLALLLFDRRLIGREEENLLATQGDSYRAYCAAVPRLVPALAPRLPSGGRAPRWGDALVGESFFWILAIAALVLAVTLDMKVTAALLGAALVLYVLLLSVWKRQRPGSGGAPKS